MPLPAHRIATTSRITNGSQHEHAHDKTPPPRLSQHPRKATRDDGRDGRRDAPPQRHLLAYRHDDGTQNATANTATRPTTRRNGTRGGTNRLRNEGRDDGRDEKTGRPTKRKAARKTERDTKLNDTPLTTRRCYRHRNRNHPANEGNQGDENDNTHTAHASSQSPQGCHR